MGKVIGKQGRVAKAIRSVVKAAASKDDRKVVVDILQLQRPGGFRHRDFFILSEKILCAVKQTMKKACSEEERWRQCFR